VRARALRPRKLVVLVLLMVALGSVGVALANMVRGPDVWLLLSVTVAGLLVGWGFAALPLRGWAATVLIPALGLAGVLVRVGRLGGELGGLLRAAVVLVWDVFRWSQSGLLPDWSPVGLALAELWAGVSALLSRTSVWVLSLATGERAFDPVAAALLWGMALWAVSGWAGWVVRRRSLPLLALIPAVALVTSTLSYAGGGHFALAVLLGAMLLLLACIRYDVRASRWQAAGIPFAGLWSDVARPTLVLSLMLVLVAGLSPSFSMQKVVSFVQSFGGRREEVEAFAESLGVDTRSDLVESNVFSDLRVTGLPRRHVLGAEPQLLRRTVMTISTGDLPPGPPSEVMRYQFPPRYYWRSRTYDRYVYFGWYAGETETIEYAAGEPAITTTLPTQRIVQQEVAVLNDSEGLLYAAGELVVADQDYRVAWRSGEDAFGASVEAAHYRAESLVNEVPEEALRSAGNDYPDWVKDRYLALPDTVPERVLALARDLTATEPTPYDRALAIESYLRRFPYTLDVPTPPSGHDVVDYFLFELQEGYCDYYATAMVVLARAAGLPARLVVGYASGRYNAFKAHYVVTVGDAHAWAEVYFPGYGWVEFEPTGGRPPIARPSGAVPFTRHAPEEELRPPVESRGKPDWYWWLGAFGALALLLLAGAAWLAIEGWRLRRLRPAAAMAALYGRLWRSGLRLAVPMRAGDTPHEFAVAFAGRVADLAVGGRWGRVLSPVAQESRRLAELYVQASYTSRPPGAGEQARAVKTWQRLRWRLWLARVWLRWTSRPHLSRVVGRRSG